MPIKIFSNLSTNRAAIMRKLNSTAQLAARSLRIFSLAINCQFIIKIRGAYAWPPHVPMLLYSYHLVPSQMTARSVPTPAVVA